MSNIKLFFAFSLLFAAVANAATYNKDGDNIELPELADDLESLGGSSVASSDPEDDIESLGGSSEAAGFNAYLCSLNDRVGAMKKRIAALSAEEKGIAAALGAAGLVAGAGAYKAGLFGKSPVVAEPPQQPKQSKLGKAAAYTGAALAVASGVGAVAFADQIKEKAGENKVTNALVGIKDTFTGKNEQAENDVNEKTTKNSASSVAIGATAFAAVAFAIAA